MRDEDFIGPACNCLDCVAYEVDGKGTRRDPHTGRWLHGYALKRWYAAKADYDAKIAAYGIDPTSSGRPRGKAPSRGGRLVRRDPGMEG